MRRVRRVALVGLIAAVAACVPQRRAPPPPQPRQPVQQPQRPVRPPPPPPARADWRDVPLTPGAWIYRQQGGSSIAMFGQGAGEAAFTVRCDRAGRQIVVSRQGRGAPGGTMILRSSETARSLPATTSTGAPAYVWASLDTRDPLLDNLAFSRGRFTVEMPGAPMLVIPAWPEPARVIEDCRS